MSEKLLPGAEQAELARKELDFALEIAQLLRSQGQPINPPHHLTPNTAIFLVLSDVLMLLREGLLVPASPGTIQPPVPDPVRERAQRTPTQLGDPSERPADPPRFFPGAGPLSPFGLYATAPARPETPQWVADSRQPPGKPIMRLDFLAHEQTYPALTELIQQLEERYAKLPPFLRTPVMNRDMARWRQQSGQPAQPEDATFLEPNYLRAFWVDYWRESRNRVGLPSQTQAELEQEYDEIMAEIKARRAGDAEESEP